MSHMLSVPDELYQQLAAYASEHHQTPEEVLASFIQGLPRRANQPEPAEAAAPVTDPWEGFYGRFTADVPDLTINHDKYLAEAYMETHDDDA
jgi:hypothetical protein